MKPFRTSALLTLLVSFLGSMAPASAQFFVQPLTVSMTAYDAPGHRTVRITTKELVRHLLGTNVPNARLDLVTPIGNEPGLLGNLHAFLRIRSGNNTVAEITSPDQFNLYQDVAALRTNGVTVTTHAVNRFSIDNGAVRAEIQGFSNWSIPHRFVEGVDTSGAGAFHSNVNGWIYMFDVSEENLPVKGSIVAGKPLLEP